MATKMIASYQPQGGRVLEKDQVGIPLNSGLLYEGGPWSLAVGEVMSEVVQGGSPLMQWIPTRGVIHKNEHIAHLSFVAPEGFDGSQSYMDYLSGLDPIGECEYGPSSDWNGFEYRHEMYRVTFKSDTLTRRNFGMKAYENQPVYRLRGDNAGMSIDNDGDWALARVAYQLENHMNWNLIYGDPAAGQLMYHGLDNILEPGWVGARAIGPGQVTFSDPYVVNGVGMTDPATVVATLRGMVRRIRMRAAQRGSRLTSNDYAIVMSGAHWASLADHLAVVGVIPVVGESTSLAVSVDSIEQARQRLTSGGLGFGNLMVDGQAVPIIIEDALGANVDIGGATPGPGITGDIYVLTRYFRGQTILEHQFLDWNRLPTPDGLQLNEFIRQNGMIRAGWVTEANACFYYYVDMWGRLISRYQPLQAKLKDVTLSTLLPNENESMSFTNQDFAAYDGARGGQGESLLIGRKTL